MQGGYVAEDLYQRLATEGRIAESLTKKELESIRHHLHALLNNDLAMNAAFRPFSTFGNDYTGTSELFLSQHTRLDGYAGTFIYQILEATREGKEVIKVCAGHNCRAGRYIDVVLAACPREQSIRGCG